MSGLEYGISPLLLVFNGSVGGVLCEEVTLSTSGEGRVFAVSDAWALRPTKRLPDYILLADELHLSVAYPLSVRVAGEERMQVCIRGERAGIYHGVILFRSLQENVGVGTWMLVELRSNKSLPFSSSVIAVSEDSLQSDEMMIVYLAIEAIFLTIVMLCFLGIVWVRRWKRQRLEEYAEF